MVSILMDLVYQECQLLLSDYKHAPQILTNKVLAGSTPSCMDFVATELLQVVWYDRNNSCHKPVVDQCHLMVKFNTGNFP